MRLAAVGVVVAALITGSPAAAQVAPAKPDPNVIVVTGERSKPSDWRIAETPHVVVLSNGSEKELIEIAHDLEREYFLLSVVLGRPDQPDDTIKLRVTLIGDVAEFASMNLRNLRWQQGPFNSSFDISRYYDPRQDGAVLASTRIDQKVVLERGTDVAFALQGLNLPSSGPQSGPAPLSDPTASGAIFGLQSEADLIPPVNEDAFPVEASSLFYAAFAQHYIETFYPAAYPRWFMDGFGQIFASMVVRGDTTVEYGRAPVGTTATLRRFGSYPLGDVLNGKYLTENPSQTRWTPVHAWMLTHFLFFSPTRSVQLRRYLHAIASGQSLEQAAAVFGDPDVLAKELHAYYHAKKPYERMTYPADRASAPAIRRLNVAEAAFVKGRLELGSRIEIPPAPPAGASPEVAARMTAQRTTALAQRDRWLARLRDQAARFPSDAGAQLLLAEAECRSGNPDRCRAVADGLLARQPDNASALAWKGLASAHLAGSGPPGDRAAALHSARELIARANRADTDAVLPLIAYYQSFADIGEAPPLLALDGLTRALDEVPNAPATRLALGGGLANAGFPGRARSTLQPVATGAYVSPERPAAQAILDRLGAAPPSATPAQQ